MPQLDHKKFFDGFKASFDPTLDQKQTDGIEFLLSSFESDKTWADVRHIAYALATIYHETAGSMQPVQEGYYLGAGAEAYQKTLRYYPYYGRGYVQLTWVANYKKAGDALGIDLERIPELALQPATAFKILTLGMFGGWFSGKKLTDYINQNATDYISARKIINGNDKAALIAGYARSFEKILKDSAAASSKPASDSAVSGTISDPQETDSQSQPSITSTEQTQSQAVQTGAMTAVTATTVTSEQPKGDDPSVPPVQVSRNGGRAYWQAASGGVGTAATAVLGYLTGHLDAAAIIAIVVGAIVISLIFRGAITDAIRMQTAADPDKKNVT